MRFVLNRCKEFFGVCRFWRIVNRRCVNIGNFLIGHPLTGPDVPNLLQQLIKKSCTEAGTVLKTIAVNGKTFMDILLKDRNRPLPELGASFGIDPVTNGNDGFQRIKFCLIGFAVLGSMCIICTY